MGGWLENWRVIPISAFNYVIVEVVAEIGKNGGIIIIMNTVTTWLLSGDRLTAMPPLLQSAQSFSQGTGVINRSHWSTGGWLEVTKNRMA